MALKTTPDKYDKKRILSPRRLNLEEEPQSSNVQDRILKSRKRHKHRADASNTAVVTPTIIHPQPQPKPQPQPRIYRTHPPVYPLGFSPAVPAATMTSYAHPIITGYGYPDTRWNTYVATIRNPLYSVPLHAVPRVPLMNRMPMPPINGIPVPHMNGMPLPPMNRMPLPIFSPMGYMAQIYPYNTSVLGSPLIQKPPMYVVSPMAASVAPPDYNYTLSVESAFYEQSRAEQATVEDISNTDFDEINSLSVQSALYDQSRAVQAAVENISNTNTEEIIQILRTSPVRSPNQFKPLDPESYLLLPKELFPTARTLAVDPNPMIDELCRIFDVNKHSPWILDLEFGVPREPVTRPIATYDAQFNSIHCKNTPGAIHPGFESCSQDFRRVILFYYDCAISSWYKGFVITYSDKSVANFQSWLQVPMQVFGMCWP